MWVRGVPYAEFGRLRAEAPVAWSPDEGSGFWSVHRYAAEVDGNRLSETDLDNFFSILVVAGNETTRIAIAQGVLAFCERPQEWDRLRADPGLLDTATDEVLRWSCPTHFMRRTATAGTSLGGAQIRAGDKVVLWYVSGNRDEAEFDQPDTFDVGRCRSGCRGERARDGGRLGCADDRAAAAADLDGELDYAAGAGRCGSGRVCGRGGEAYELVTSLVPQRRPASADEVAASYVNGAVIPVDGGGTAVDVGTVPYDSRVEIRRQDGA
jgi:hypothetical protein